MQNANEALKGIKARFLWLYSITVLLFIVLLLIFTRTIPNPFVSLKTGAGSSKTSTAELTPDKELLNVNEVLQVKLQQLNEKYAGLLGVLMVNTAPPNATLKKSLQLADAEFQKALDSIGKSTPNFRDKYYKDDIQATLAFFNTAAENLKSMVSMNGAEKSVPAKDEKIQKEPVSPAGAQALIALKKDAEEKSRELVKLKNRTVAQLEEKDRAIAALQKEVRKQPAASFSSTTTHSAYAPALGGSVKDLQQSIINLRLANKTYMNQNIVLTRTNAALQQDNQRLIQQLTTLRKTAGRQ